MVAVINQLLTKDQVRSIATKLFSASFADGAMSGGALSSELKKNTQVPPNSPEYRELAELVMGAMRQNAVFNQTALPRRILSPIFSAYSVGDRYDRHIDAALMGPYPGMRTDLSITIFLNGPDAYEGGELTLESPFGEHKYKLSPGDAVLYPTHYTHQVTPVTKGRRLAAVTWIESMIPDPQQREVLSDFAELAEALVSSKADMELIRKLEKGRLNLTRMWTRT